MTDSERYIGIKVNPETKERWQQAAEENPEYRSLTHLIAVAVEAELGEQPETTGKVDVDMNGVHERLDNIRDEMREMADIVDETYMLTRNEEMSDYNELKGIVQDLIPTGDREEILKRTPEKPPMEIAMDELEVVIGRTGSVSHLARLLQQKGYTPIEIKGVVEQLAEDVKGIEATFARLQDEEDKRIYRTEGYDG